MKYTLSFLALTMLLLTSCGSGKEQTKTVDTADEASVSSEETAIISSEREPTDDEIREFGMITEIEDSPYPRFVITVEFPERQMTLDFNFNLAESPLTDESLMAMRGNYATLYYVSEMDPILYDMVLDCESLLGDDAADINDANKEITGILKGAQEATDGDLPDKISITSSDGNSLSFDYFVTETMAAANGEEVTLFYNTRYINEIIYMMLSKED